MELPQATKPRSRIYYGWYIVAASFFSNLALTASFWQGFQVFFLPILREFGWSRAAISGAVSLRQLETGLFAPFLGFAVDRLGPRRIIIASGIIVGLGMMALSQTSSLWTFYLFFLVASIGGSGASHGITWPVAIARWFRRKRGLALGLGTSGPFLAGLILPVAAWLVQEIGWRTTIFLMGLALLLIITPLGSLVRDRPEASDLAQNDSESDKAQSEHESRGPVASQSLEGFTLSQALHDRTFWVASLAFGILQFGSSSFQVHQIPYFESLDFSTSKAALTVTFVLLFSGIGRMGAGSLADLLELRWVLVIVTGMNVAGWIYLDAIHVTGLLAALPFTFLFGVSFGANVSLRPALLSKLFGNRALGSLSGLNQIGALVSGIVGPVAAGYIFDVSGEYTLALHLFIAVTLATFPVALMIKQPGAQSPSHVSAP